MSHRKFSSSRHGALLILAVLLLVGCSHSVTRQLGLQEPQLIALPENRVRAQFEREFQCAQGAEVEAIGDSHYAARGCGKRAFYECHLVSPSRRECEQDRR